MTNTFHKKHATVFTSDQGRHLVMLPSGELLSGIIKTTVIDAEGEPAELTVELYVNLAKDKEDALAKYKQGG